MVKRCSTALWTWCSGKGVWTRSRRTTRWRPSFGKVILDPSYNQHEYLESTIMMTTKTRRGEWSHFVPDFSERIRRVSKDFNITTAEHAWTEDQRSGGGEQSMQAEAVCILIMMAVMKTGTWCTRSLGVESAQTKPKLYWQERAHLFLPIINRQERVYTYTTIDLSVSLTLF